MIFPEIETGINEVTFKCNPNKTGEEVDFIMANKEKFPQYVKMHYSIATIGKGNTIYVFFPVVQKKGGGYPYCMAVIGHGAMTVKNKTMKVNLKVFHTEMTEMGVIQYAMEFIR